SASDLSTDWRDLLAALEFARDRFEQWGRDGVLTDAVAKPLTDHYGVLREELAGRARRGEQPPADLYLPPEGPASGWTQVQTAARAVRFWKFLAQEIRRQEGEGRLPLADSHACLTEAQERINFLRKRLDRPEAGEPA